MDTEVGCHLLQRHAPTSNGELAPPSPDGQLFATVHQTVGDLAQIEVWDSRPQSQLGLPLTGPVDALG
jgi:hypothetical protein